MHMWNLIYSRSNHIIKFIFREDGSFVISGVPPGSYIIEISNIDYAFEPVRVDITSKGKIRARRLNLLQVSF